MFNFYINLLRDEYIKNNKLNITYKEWLEMWKVNNKELAEKVDDGFYSILGNNIIDILNRSNMLSIVLRKGQYYNDHPFYVLRIRDEKLLSKNTKQKVFSVPLKLPMIWPPKIYTCTDLGGYLLNNEKFSEELIIDKKGYAISSEI
jgi:hypothetical protein